jgi:hypothetical protein
MYKTFASYLKKNNYFIKYPQLKEKKDLAANDQKPMIKKRKLKKSS